jgi:hypothetical protein
MAELGFCPKAVHGTCALTLVANKITIKNKKVNLHFIACKDILKRAPYQKIAASRC